MIELHRDIVRADLRLSHFVGLTYLRRIIRLLWRHAIGCTSGSAVAPTIVAAEEDLPFRYRRLREIEEEAMPVLSVFNDSFPLSPALGSAVSSEDIDSLISLKISMLGDCGIGKTSFMVKCVGEEEERKGLQMNGLNLMDKVFFIRGVRIAFRIWDVGGDRLFLDHMPLACKDSAAILIMFDLTNRSTLTNTVHWFCRARRWNKTGIPILVGTKFDEFVGLPLNIQWAIVNEARVYTSVMKATLFFSSTTHNINVNKIFKFITAKIFNLPWNIERNLKVGEPTIDF